MALIIWDDKKYGVNIEKINSEHQKLVGIINKLHEAMLEAKSRDVLADVLSEMIDYTKTHFKTEEELMEKYSYPDYEFHKKKHQYYVDKIANFYQTMESGKGSVSVEILVFLKDWLMNHIAIEDKRYTKFFNDLGIY